MTLEDQIIQEALRRIETFMRGNGHLNESVLDLTNLTGSQELSDVERTEIFEKIIGMVIHMNNRIESHKSVLPTIRKIDISDNKLVDLPNNFAELDLVCLKAKNNKFDKIPVSLSSQENLTELNFEGNRKLKEIPVEMSKLTKLHLLDLSNCDIQFVNTTQQDLGVFNLPNLRSININGNDNLPSNFMQRFQATFGYKLQASDQMRHNLNENSTYAAYLEEVNLDLENILSELDQVVRYRNGGVSDLTVDQLLAPKGAEKNNDMDKFLEPLAKSMDNKNVYVILTVKDVDNFALREIKESRIARHLAGGYQSYALDINPNKISDPNSEESIRLKEIFQILSKAKDKAVIEINHHGLPTNVDPDLMGEVVAEMLYNAGFRGHARVIYGPCNADVGTEAERFTNKLKELGCEQVVVESLNGMRSTKTSPKVDPITGVHSEIGLTYKDYKAKMYDRYLEAKKNGDYDNEKIYYKGYHEAEVHYFDIGEESIEVQNIYGEMMFTSVYSHDNGNLNHSTFRYISNPNQPVEVIRNKDRALEVIDLVNQARNKKQSSIQAGTSQINRSQGGRSALTP